LKEFNGEYQYNGTVNCKSSYKRDIGNGDYYFIKWFEEAEYKGYIIGVNTKTVDTFRFSTTEDLQDSACPSQRLKWQYYSKPVRSIDNTATKRSARFKIRA